MACVGCGDERDEGLCPRCEAAGHALLGCGCLVLLDGDVLRLNPLCLAQRLHRDSMDYERQFFEEPAWPDAPIGPVAAFGDVEEVFG